MFNGNTNTFTVITFSQEGQLVRHSRSWADADADADVEHWIHDEPSFIPYFNTCPAEGFGGSFSFSMYIYIA